MSVEKTKEVWFVGSNPSKYNTNPEIPFHGTKSLIVLLEWIKTLGLDRYHLINISSKLIEYNKLKITPQEMQELNNKLHDKTIVVALGLVASKALTQLKIKHFLLPHPSGRNRMLNDKTMVEKTLQSCKEYITMLKG